MQHRIPVERLGPQGPVMAEAVARCVHCGFCLATCPTYLTLGQEMDSPRGRIVLMKEVLEGGLPLTETVRLHLDRCLGCLACVSACPSGVAYGALLTSFRAWGERQVPRPLWQRAWRWGLIWTLSGPRRFAAAARLGLAARPLARWLPARLRAMVELLPERLPPPEPLAAVHPARGPRRARVALLAGCVQRVLGGRVHQATVEVLTRHGVEVVVPRGQGCCGALAWHAGLDDLARALARRNLPLFAAPDLDAVVVNAAGCGSAMREYPLLFAGLPEEEAARAVARRVRDVAAFLAELDPEPPGPLPRPLRVAYHDACHLAHGQGVREQPRRLLQAIPNLTLLELPEAELCCGSAGTYNLEQPEIAARLGARKAEHVLASGADAVATGNVGCLVQIQAGLRRRGSTIPVVHTVELLAEAYGGAG